MDVKTGLHLRIWGVESARQINSAHIRVLTHVLCMQKCAVRQNHTIVTNCMVLSGQCKHIHRVSMVVRDSWLPR